MKLRFHREAQNEMVDAANFHEGERPGLGRRFEIALEKAFGMILASPMTWRVYVKNVRKYQMKKFRYSIFYRVDDDVVTILSIMHGKRRPDYWLDRL